MKHRLTVKIEKRFKRQLSKRFNPRNATIINDLHVGRQINVGCILCKECLDYENFNCDKCPFGKFGYKFQKGCMFWINKVMEEEQLIPIYISIKRIHWCEGNNKRAIEFLKKLRAKAKKYIVWV